MSRKTCLVFGAGVSRYYGFPLGPELATEIIRIARNPGDARNAAVCRLRHIPWELEKFAEALEATGAKSIDAFLRERADLQDLGKKLIVAVLIAREQPGQLLKLPDSHGPYEHILDRVVPRVRSGEDAMLSIVNLNYDRSFQERARRVFEGYRCNASEAIRLTKLIPVVHLHGALGSLFGDEGPVFDYTHEPTAERIDTASSRIVIPSERRKSQDLYASACKLLREADQRVFLGFGYHRDVVERLGWPEGDWPAGTCGTAFGLGAADRREVQRLLGGQASLAAPEVDIMTMLREEVDFG